MVTVVDCGEEGLPTYLSYAGAHCPLWYMVIEAMDYILIPKANDEGNEFGTVVPSPSPR